MKTKINLHIVLVLTIFIIVLTPTISAQAADDRFVVVLDAGHGGHDPGNLGNRYKEKDIALNVTLEVGKALEANKNIKVIYTRTKDVFLELYERSAIANRADADLFVSIHCNSHSSNAYGTETFVLGVANTERNLAVARKENEVIYLEENYQKNYGGFDPSSPESTIGIQIEQEEYVNQSIILARKIEDNFSQKLKRKSRGLKQASLWVMHNTYMPSVLVELGFLTNKSEGAFLNSKAGQRKMADAIRDAIIEYKDALDLNVGDNFLVYDDGNSTDNNTLVIEDVEFKVQIAASRKDLAPKSYNFKGLNDISKDKVGQLYKYYFGKTSDYNQALKFKEEAKSKGYSTCFIVAYRDGERITINEALKSATN
ncbi:MAG: N-acetylmuramoyl-L-alanine amidase [Winogradskyella sp.]|nr:N-acetylmuramoyl-L-alanine amidase [Winogradskyella sp.]